MKKIKKYASGTLAALALTLLSVSSQAQTTNLMVYNFNTDINVYNGGSSVWGNWFGGVYQSAFWDSTQDSSNNPSSGSMEVTLLLPSDQYVLNDGQSPGYVANIVTTFTNLSFDIRYDASSAIRTNTTASDNGSTGIGSLDYGYMRVGSSKNNDQDWFYYFAIPATNGLGQPNTNWVHISIPLNKDTVLSQAAELTTFTSLLFGMDAANYGNSGLMGNQTYWLDNIQFIGPQGGIPLPPPVMGIKPATTPALRLFGGSGGQYSRSQLTTIDQNQSWIGVAYPVSYSFTLLNAPTTPGNMDMHIFFMPLIPFSESINNNHDMDYHMPNLLWLRVRSGVGSDTCTADISWKTNAGYNNPNHTDLQISNPKAVGTWTLTFNSASSGTLTAPGASPAPFTLSDPTVAIDFGGPMILSFGNQCNGVSLNQGVPNDWAKISVSGVAGLNETNDFTTETNIDPLVWDTSNSNTKYSVVLVTTNDHYWVTWSSPSTGYELGVAPKLTGPWKLPEFYNSYATGTNSVPYEALQGTLNWALIPSSCLPTVDGQPQTGQALSPYAFFRLSNPPLAQ